MVQLPHLKCSVVHGQWQLWWTPQTGTVTVTVERLVGHGVYPLQGGMSLVAIATWPGTKDRQQHVASTQRSVTRLDIQFPSPLFLIPISF